MHLNLNFIILLSIFIGDLRDEMRLIIEQNKKLLKQNEELIKRVELLEEKSSQKKDNKKPQVIVPNEVRVQYFLLLFLLCSATIQVFWLK